ncbi:caltractin-like isoform X2 [Varroa jacobsoni]|uniref:EF-hand domain-containing protein n=2 Tax=Varroa TaxID=62624 RepID=A0A7M7KGR3_VARDE|nr:caltractin-like [Varroa destructor]XP_022709048.1 caltractin-like isoform X2 [Varroa jacobsoni]XP_022709049.1 caltractin-like isoform X2 [Varroa jacobsoni]
MEKMVEDSDGLERKKSLERTSVVPEEIRATFAMFDRNGDGLPAKELKFAMRALGLEPRKEEVKKLLTELGKQDSPQARLTLTEFEEVIRTRLREDPNDETLKAFKLFDERNTGMISLEDLQRVANELGAEISEEELRQMIEEADNDGDGLVSEMEFLRIMKRTCLY